MCTKDFKNSMTVVPTSPEKWEAYSYSSAFIMLAKHPITANVVAGKTFYVYNPERIILNMTKAQFLADPATAIKNAIPLPVGYTRTPRSRLLFNMSQLLSESVTTQRTTIASLKTSIPSKFLCETDVINAPRCHTNNLGAYIPGFSYTADGTIYSSATDGSGYVGTTAYQRFGTFDLGCRKDEYTSILYTPNTSPLTQGWSWWDGIGTAQTDGAKLVWQINDATDDDGAHLFKKASVAEAADIMQR